jgi:hypothetical protein
VRSYVKISVKDNLLTVENIRSGTYAAPRSRVHRPRGATSASRDEPKRGSWDAVRPPRGYRVVLLTAGHDPATTTLVTAVKQWARAETVRLETVAVTRSRPWTESSRP